LSRPPYQVLLDTHSTSSLEPTLSQYHHDEDIDEPGDSTEKMIFNHALPFAPILPSSRYMISRQPASQPASHPRSSISQLQNCHNLTPASHAALLASSSETPISRGILGRYYYQHKASHYSSPGTVDSMERDYPTPFNLTCHQPAAVDLCLSSCLLHLSLSLPPPSLSFLFITRSFPYAPGYQASSPLSLALLPSFLILSTLTDPASFSPLIFTSSVPYGEESRRT
jgi:hypothetical protein